MLAARRIACLPLKSFRSVIACKSMQTDSNALVFNKAGEPLDVLQMTPLDIAPPGKGQIAVKMRMAPINPSDINTIQGKYPLCPPMPGVGGHEGVGEVTAVGHEVSRLTVGDLVVPLESAQGTWRQAGVFDAHLWHAVPRSMRDVDAAALVINPPTALGMLESFVDLREGDVVVQNGANSAVGQAVIRIAHARGVKTINIIRDRPNWKETEDALMSIGATAVCTEDNVRDVAKQLKLPAAALALNCVGGSSATTMAKMLRNGGTIVTYGGMSMQPVTIPTPLLIFKDIKAVGFWVSGNFTQKLGLEGKMALIDRCAELFLNETLHTEAEVFAMSDWKQAISKAQTDRRSTKIMLDLSK